MTARDDRTAKRRGMFSQRLQAATTQRERAAAYSAWVHAALANLPAGPDGATRAAGDEATEELIETLEALERDAARATAQVGGVS